MTKHTTPIFENPQQARFNPYDHSNQGADMTTVVHACNAHGQYTLLYKGCAQHATGVLLKTWELWFTRLVGGKRVLIGTIITELGVTQDVIKVAEPMADMHQIGVHRTAVRARLKNQAEDAAGLFDNLTDAMEQGITEDIRRTGRELRTQVLQILTDLGE